MQELFLLTMERILDQVLPCLVGPLVSFCVYCLSLFSFVFLVSDLVCEDLEITKQV